MAKAGPITITLSADTSAAMRSVAEMAALVQNDVPDLIAVLGARFSDLFTFDADGTTELRDAAIDLLFTTHLSITDGRFLATVAPTDRYHDLFAALAEAAGKLVALHDGWPCVFGFGSRPASDGSALVGLDLSSCDPDAIPAGARSSGNADEISRENGA